MLNHGVARRCEARLRRLRATAAYEAKQLASGDEAGDDAGSESQR